VVVVVHEPGDAAAEFFEGGEAVAVEELVLEDRPERFSGGVDETRPGPAHGSDQAGCGAQIDHGLRRELRTSVGVKYGPGTGEPPDEDGVAEGLFNQLLSHVVRHREAQDPSGVLISDGIELGRPLTGLESTGRRNAVKLCGLE
jgi:hypothetical protein